MSCLKTLNMTGGCPLETCSDAAQVPISGVPTLTQEQVMAYAPDLCYCLVAGTDGATTYFFKYEPATNTMTLKGSHAGAPANVNMAYDVAHQKFVTAVGTTIVIFDPITETISDFIPPGVVGTVFKFVYVAGSRNKIYGHIGQDGLGQKYVGYIDLDLLTVVQLGVAPAFGGSFPFMSNLAYSPLTDNLYGCWQSGIGKGFFEFNLTTNLGAYFFTGVATWAQFDCCWDSDRNLMICAGDAMREIDVVAQTIVRTTNINFATLSDLRFTPFYVSSMKRVFLTGFDNSGDKVIGKYPTEAPYIGQLVKNDYLYQRILQFDEGSFFSIANTKPAGVNGWRRLCLTA